MPTRMQPGGHFCVIVITTECPPMKYLLLAVAILCTNTILSAQSDRTGLRGQVIDEHDEALTFVTVGLFKLSDSTMTKAGYSESDGSFEFTYVTPGTYYLNVTMVGYDVYLSEPVEIRAGEITTVKPIRLEPFVTQLGEVVVTTTRPVVEVKPDKTVFNIEGTINAIGENAIDLLRKAPGVVVDNNDRLMLLGKNGVRVYVDGKQSQLGGDDLANYLRSLQSNQIEAIEIITQPSSRYEADGNAGIINIRLIKDKGLGTNATVSVAHAQAMHGRSNANVNFNNRSRRLNVFGNANYALGANSSYQHFERTTPTSFTFQDSKGKSEWDNGSLRLGADLSVGRNATAGLLLDGYQNAHDYTSTTETYVSDDAQSSPYLLLLGKSANHRSRTNYNVNGNYRYDDKKGTVFNADIDYGSFTSDGDSYQPNYYFDAGTGELQDTRIFTSDAPTTIDIRTLKVDYERPLMKGQLGAGLKLALIDTDNDYRFFDLVDDDPVLNPDISNRFQYEENVNAAYLNYNRSLKKLSFQLGVRAEYTRSTGELLAYKPQGDEVVQRDYLDLFPSGGLTFQASQNHSLRLTYSRRIDRPNYQDLTPFEFRLDELTFQKGNPFLRPQYTNSFQLSHTYKYTLNTTLSYSHTSDLIAELTDTSGVRGAFITKANVAEQDVFSLGVSYPFALSKRWNVFGNATVSHTHNQGVFDTGKTVDIRATTFNIYMQHSYVLTKTMTFEISGWYNSPGIWGGNFASKEMWAIDAGIQQKVFQGRGTLKVSVSDIFRSQRWGGYNSFGALAMRANGGWESRQLKVNLTYLLGNQQVKSSRRRSTGLEDEAKRIQRDN